jgi:NAD+ diphosphatase
MLTKYRIGYNNYALVAGYNEIGETLEDTVRREVMEEVGLSVKNVRYYKSQPWGLSGSVLSGFWADISDLDDNPKVDLEELKLAKWASRDEIEILDDGVSLTREMINYFKSGKKIDL